MLGDTDFTVLSCAWSPCGQRIAFSSLDSPYIEQHVLKGAAVAAVTLGEKLAISKPCYIKSTIESLSITSSGKMYFLTSLDEVFMTPDPVYSIDTAEQNPKATKVISEDDDGADSLVVASGHIVVNTQVRTGTVISELNGCEVLHRATDIRAWDAYYDSENKAWVLAVALSDTNSPSEVYIARPGEDELQLSNHGAVFAKRRFGTFNVLNSTSTYGVVDLDGLYITPSAANTGPDGTPQAPLPTVVVIHGGPNFRNFDMFDCNLLYWTSYLLCMGYGVLLP